jgi:hypothetical protein
VIATARKREINMSDENQNTTQPATSSPSNNQNNDVGGQPLPLPDPDLVAYEIKSVICSGKEQTVNLRKGGLRSI